MSPRFRLWRRIFVGVASACGEPPIISITLESGCEESEARSWSVGATWMLCGKEFADRGWCFVEPGVSAAEGVIVLRNAVVGCDESEAQSWSVGAALW